MRHVAFRFAVSLPLWALALPVVAQPTPPARPAAAAERPVQVRTGQQINQGRVALTFARPPAHDMRKVDGGYELRLAGSFQFDLSAVRPLTEVTAIAARQEGDESVLRFTVPCACIAEVAWSEGKLRLNFHTGGATSRAPQPRPEAYQAAVAEVTRRRLAEEAARPARATPADAAPTQAPQAEEVARLRQSIVSQLEGLNTRPAQPQPAPQVQPQPAAPQQQQSAASLPPVAAPPRATTPATATATSSAPVQAPAPATVPRSADATPFVPPARIAPVASRTRPACAPSFELGNWGGGGGTGFMDRMIELRRALAASADAPEDAAELAEFLVSYGLVNEALDLLRGRLGEDLAEASRLRLQRVRDVARLLRRMPLEANSPLLAEAATCEREDLGLWQALAAGAAGDAVAASRLVPRALRGLRAAPERLRFAFTFALADALGDDAAALRALVAPLRTSTPAFEAEAANRDWLMARIAGLAGARDEEQQHLQRAAAAPRTVAGLFATARLAARTAERAPGAPATPEMLRAEDRLLDLARTYRRDALGEEASMLRAGLLLRRDDLAGALPAADAASQAGGRRTMESRGATLAARILRLLLVDAEGRPLPSPEARMALYWDFEGYATPGERGDDIRLGATRLMLDQGLVEAGLDVARQFAPATLQNPAAALLLARAEALASGGESEQALALLRPLPATAEVHAVAALALARLDRPAEAAEELAGQPGLPAMGNRARYLYQAQRWPEAAAAYAALLRQQGLEAVARIDATGHYATATLLAPQPGAALPAALLAPRDAGIRGLLQLVQAPAAPADLPRIDILRNAIERSKQIETLLPEER